MILDVLAAEWLSVLANKSIYVSLHYAVPPLNDPTATEITGATYHRQSTTFSSTEGNARISSNDTVLRWSGLDSTTITHVGVFDGPYTSTLLFYVSLSTLFSVRSNGTFEIAAEDLYLRIP